GSVGDRTIAFGAGEWSEHGAWCDLVAACAGDALILGHDLAVASPLVSGLGEPFPVVFEEIELVIELALHKESLATIDLGGGQELAARVGMDAQRVRYLVRSAQWRIDTDDCRSEGKREQGKDDCRKAPKSPTDARLRAR